MNKQRVNLWAAFYGHTKEKSETVSRPRAVLLDYLNKTQIDLYILAFSALLGIIKWCLAPSVAAKNPEDS